MRLISAVILRMLQNARLVEICFFAVVFLGDMAFLSANEWSRIDKDQLRGAFSLIEWHVTNNLDAIETWTGKCLVSDKIQRDHIPSGSRTKRLVDGDFMRTLDCEVNFWCNLTTDELLIKYVPSGKVKFASRSDEAAGSASEAVSDGFEMWTLMTNGEGFRLRPNEAFGRLEKDPVVPGWKPHLSRVIRRYPPNEVLANAAYGDMIDPRSMFGQPTVSFRKLLDSLVAGADRLSMEDLRLETLEKQQGRFEYRWSTVAQGDRRYRTTHWVHEDVGFNLVRYVLQPVGRDSILQEVEISYESIGGCWVPSRYIVSKNDERDGRLRLRREVVIIEQSVNVPIDRSLFSLKSFELRPGDRITDSEGSKLSVVDNDSQILSVSDFQTKYKDGGFRGILSASSRELPSKRPLLAIIVFNLCVVLLALILIISARMRRGHRGCDDAQGAPPAGKL